MTRDEAYHLILAQLGKDTGERATAAHIATALDALGLLIYAGSPLRLHPPGEEIEDISRKQRQHEDNTIAAARVVTGDVLGEAHITAADLPPQADRSPNPTRGDEVPLQPPTQGGGREYWAGKRNRA